MKYDANYKQDANSWLAMDEGERIALVIQYHEHIGDKLPNVRLHETIHVVIENQIAEGIDIVTMALQRLMADGLDRHEAIQAIGSVLSKYIWRQLRAEGQTYEASDPYLQNVSSLTADSWKKGTR